jgi:hypothetical protein
MIKETIFSPFTTRVFWSKIQCDFFAHKLLKRLIEILNLREQKLDEIIDSQSGAKDKFSLNDKVTINALLNNLYSFLQLSSLQKKLRKFQVTHQELIIAILYGFDVRIGYFKPGQLSLGLGI